MKNAAFPVIKTLDELDRSACSIPGQTLDYLATLEWITARENLCLVGPPGTGKSHVLVSLGISAVHAGHKVRYFTAADLADTLYRGLADNSAGKVIENLLRNDLILADEVGFAPLDDTARNYCSGLSQPPMKGARSGSKPLAVRILGPVPARAHHRGQPPGPPAPPRQRRRHSRRFLPDAPGPSTRRNHPEQEMTTRGVGTFIWPPAGTATWPLTSEWSIT